MPKRLTAEWYIWYGLKMGLSWDQTLTAPLPLLLDLIAVQQIKEEGFKYKPKLEDEQAEAIRLLSIK